MLKLRCGTVRDDKHFKPFAKLQPKASIYFSIKFYFGVAVLTAKVSFDDDDDDFRLIWFDFRRFRPFSNGFDTRRL